MVLAQAAYFVNAKGIKDNKIGGLSAPFCKIKFQVNAPLSL
jgi:hypothetical protein